MKNNFKNRGTTTKNVIKRRWTAGRRFLRGQGRDHDPTDYPKEIQSRAFKLSRAECGLDDFHVLLDVDIDMESSPTESGLLTNTIKISKLLRNEVRGDTPLQNEKLKSKE